MDARYEELLKQYGNEYLQEHNGDNCVYMMDEIQEFITDVWEALRSSFNGYDWCPGADNDRELRWQFNPNKEYFAFNGYGNLVSIDENYLTAYLDLHIDQEDFVEWCQEQGYIDEDEEIEGCGLIVHEPVPHDSHKSFYGKALVIDYEDGTMALKSYNTIVATYNKRTKTLTVNGWYSATTARHIRAFAAELGISLPAGTNIAGKYKRK